MSTNLYSARDDRVESVHTLRGIAAASVCTFHILYSDVYPDAVREIAGYGGQGVTAFFVVSGFVLPLSLMRANYNFLAFPTFFAKRLLRLEPTYLVTILGTVLIGFLASITPGFRGPPFSLDIVQLIAHLGYLVPFFNKEWLINVFWTLGIELQFYLFVGLAFPLLQKWPLKSIVLGAIPSLFVWPDYLLPTYMPSFLIGTVAFAWRESIIEDRPALALACGLSAIQAYGGCYVEATVAIGSAAFILWAQPRWRVLSFLGTISYSLYLVHVPIAIKLENLMLRFIHERWIIAGTQVVAILLIAYLCWRFVERPSQLLSKLIKYKPFIAEEPRHHFGQPSTLVVMPLGKKPGRE
jgi:peptidoglycan/LPS O-acetylase OafA/YrhL